MNENGGLSTRDYLAMAALQGLIASAWRVYADKVDTTALAKMAYALADAMLAERSKE